MRFDSKKAQGNSRTDGDEVSADESVRSPSHRSAGGNSPPSAPISDQEHPKLNEQRRRTCARRRPRSKRTRADGARKHIHAGHKRVWESTWRRRREFPGSLFDTQRLRSGNCRRPHGAAGVLQHNRRTVLGVAGRAAARRPEHPIVRALVEDASPYRGRGRHQQEEYESSDQHARPVMNVQPITEKER